MKTTHEILHDSGYNREFNGGGCYIHTKELSNGWTVSVCNGQACEVSDGDTQIHVNMRRTENLDVFVPGHWVKQSCLAVALVATERLCDTLSGDQET